MRSKIIIIITIIICSFSFSVNVKANVTFSYKNNNPSCSGFCNGYFMKNHYYGDGNDAICLDPAIPAPDNISFESERQLNLGDVYDDGIYRIYQKFLNEVNYLGYENSYQYFQYAARIWTINKGYDYISPSSAKFQTDAPVFIHCARMIDGNIASGKDNGWKYIRWEYNSKTGENDIKALYSLNSNLYKNIATENMCFKDSKKKDYIKSFYNAVGSKYIWDNNIKKSDITSEKIEPTTDNPNYTYKIIFDIKDFFSGGAGISVLGLDPANITAYLSINGMSCLNTSSCDATISNDNDNSNKMTINNSKKQWIFTITFTPEQHKKYFENGGSITLNYTYNHPMSHKNIFISRYDNTNEYQRMLYIKNYEHKDSYTINIGAPTTTTSTTTTNIPNITNDTTNPGDGKPSVKKCSHPFPNVYYNENGNKTNLENFVKSCKCEAVDKSILGSGESVEYEELCENVVIGEKFFGEISSCDKSVEPDNVLDKEADSNYESYEIGYEIKTQVNNYCVETCTETIDIYDLMGKYTTKAGVYFQFDRYPSLKAVKSCNIKIDYTKWKNDYVTNLTKLVDAYNLWKEAEAAEASMTTSSCNCVNVKTTSGSTYTVCSTKYDYNYSYQKVVINGTKLSYETVSNTVSSCGSQIDWDVSNKKKNFQKLSIQKTAINNLKMDLKKCNNRLFDVEADRFYDFNQQLNYYYYQTLLKKDKKTNVLASNYKEDPYVDFYRFDDSEFEVNNDWRTPTGDYNNKNEKTPITYSSLTESGIKDEEIATYLSMMAYRIVNYAVNYKPKIEKVVENYTTDVKSIKNLSKDEIKKSHIKLGYGYDTDVTALAKKDNASTYIFSVLGDINGKIFKHFSEGESQIIRSCQYEITNEVMETCNTDNGICLNLKYRMVDPANIDPNNRLVSGEGFKNWLSDEAQAVKNKIESDAENKKTFNPKNLEYSFELNSADLKEIRSYNTGSDYSDFIGYKCSGGNQCESKFVTEYASKDNNNKLVGTGRSSWKEYKKNSSTGNCYIDDELVECP